METKWTCWLGRWIFINKMNLGVRTVKNMENFVYSNSLLHLNVLDHVLIMSEVWVVLIIKLPMTLSRLIFRSYLIIFTFRLFLVVGSCLTKFLDWLGFQMLLWRRFLSPVRSLGVQAFSWAAGKLENNRIGLPTSPSSSDVQNRVLQAAAKHESQPSETEVVHVRRIRNILSLLTSWKTNSVC